MADRERDRDRDRGAKKPFKKKRSKPCFFCDGKTIDYKDVGAVRRFMSDRGKILPPRVTGCCTKHQRRIAKIIKRARHAGLVAYSGD